MQYGSIQGINKPVSRLCQGVMALIHDDIEKSLAILDQIYALGCNTFDTAHVYEGGDVDRLLGQWISTRGVRDEVVIIGKGGHPNRDRQRVTPYDITADIYDSLARLKTDHIDLYLLHRDNPALPVGPIMEMLNEHKEAGRIGVYGASNWTYQRIQEANTYAREHGLAPFVASSVQFSLAEMVMEPWPNCLSIGGVAGQEAREYYQQENIAVIPWSSLAGGFFSGRFTPDNLDTFDEYFDTICVKAYCYEVNFRRLERASTLAAEKGLTPAQIALAYVINQELSMFPLVGCKTAAEFETNLGALDVTLTPEQLDWLDLRQDAVSV